VEKKKAQSSSGDGRLLLGRSQNRPKGGKYLERRFGKELVRIGMGYRTLTQDCGYLGSRELQVGKVKNISLERGLDLYRVEGEYNIRFGGGKVMGEKICYFYGRKQKIWPLTKIFKKRSPAKWQGEDLLRIRP